MIQPIKYPRTPPEFHLMRKVFSKELAQIKYLRSEGKSYRQIAKSTGLGFSTIQRIFQTPEQKAHEKEYKYRVHSERMKNDPEYRQKAYNATVKSLSRKRKLVPEYNTYCVGKNNVLRKKFPERYRNYKLKQLAKKQNVPR